MPQPLPPSAQKVQDALHTLGFDYFAVEMPDSTRTAAEAAQAVGCQVGQIVKSLVFKTKHSQRPILVIASGANRVYEQGIGQLLGEAIEKADAEFIRQTTGFAIGGVPPVGHATRLDTLIDEDLLRFERVWAAAGTPHAVFALAPRDLVTMTGGRVVCVK
jgi:prolyl-tRNA editing enzyme YbaK/EbsC (Cys-tRNA(Pro) deacylase)